MYVGAHRCRPSVRLTVNATASVIMTTPPVIRNWRTCRTREARVLDLLPGIGEQQQWDCGADRERRREHQHTLVHLAGGAGDGDGRDHRARARNSTAPRARPRMNWTARSGRVRLRQPAERVSQDPLHRGHHQTEAGEEQHNQPGPAEYPSW